jgi:uncharacterized membrane protein
MAEFLSVLLLVIFLISRHRARRRVALLEARIVELERRGISVGGTLVRLEDALTKLQRAPGLAGTPSALEPAVVRTESPDRVLVALPFEARRAPAGPSPAPTQGGSETASTPEIAGVAAAAAEAAPEGAPAPGAATPPEAAAAPEVAPAPEAATAAEAAPVPPPPEPPAIDWERWVGVRGAALVGAGVLALAGVLFFRYAVEHSLIPPVVRVIVGTLVGVGCLLFAEWLRERYAATVNAVAGSGLVILYAAFWAARVLFDLIGMGVAFALMALTTAAGCLLAVRHSSLVIAVLGLVGGFATPLLLSSGADRPIGLFGYILLLDLGFILAARKRGWGSLMSLALAGTLLIEGAWIVLRMGPERLLLGTGVVALFGALFAWAAGKPPGASQAWFRNQVAAVLLPFGFALYFASQARLGAQLVPIAVLLALLAFGAGWIAKQVPNAAWLPLSSAVASVTVVGVWLFSAELSSAACWQAALCSAGLALVFQLRSELSAGESEASRAAAVAELGLLTLLVLAAVVGDSPAEIAPWLTGWLLLAGLATLLARFPGRGGVSLAVAVLLALGLSGFQSQRLWPQELPQLSLHFGIEATIAVAFLVVSLARRKISDHGAAALFPGVLLLCLAVTPSLFDVASPGVPLGASLVLGALALFGATRLGDGRALALAALPLVAVEHAAAYWLTLEGSDAGWALLLSSAGLLLVSFWPLLVHSRLSHPRWAFYTSALAGPLWFLGLRNLYQIAFGSSTIGVLPTLLGALSLGILWYTRRSQALASEVLRSALAWYAAVALGFISVAIPLQLDRQWITIGWALESAAVLVLFRRLNHAGLKWLGLGLALAVTARLVLNPAVLEYADRGWPFLNWLAYTYWVPALALLGAHRALRDLELERLRPWERQLYRTQPAGALGLGLAVILIVFVWINLSIMDAFGEGTRLTLDFARRPTRDLVLSLSWAAYAGVLLTLGMAKRARGPRWLSLGLLILTIGKVFLYDLGQLQDLYQVLSLLGLALSLIAVSLAYQRFVFGKKAVEAA